MSKGRTVLFVALLLGLALLLAACQKTAEPTPCPDCPAAVTCPEATPCPVAEAGVEAPYVAAWQGSGHAAADSEAFRHWDGSDPAVVPTGCAKCHAGAGLVDFLTTGKNEAVIDATTVKGIDCVSCHNAASSAYTSVTFPSGVVISGLGREALCMTCHQGRESKVSVDAQIERFKVEDLDAVVAPIKDDAGKDVNFGFRNVHYFAAAATLFGSEVHGGYEYEGLTYDWKFAHIDGYDTCIDCHDSHTLQVKVDQCASCHEGVATAEDLKNIRMLASTSDYDGDGNVTEGMFFEIQGLQEKLLAQMQTYAKEKTGSSVIYDAAAYPYWFADAEGDGVIDQKDGANVSFTTWTARLLKAAYNYQVSIKDPGAFAHGNKYIVQLLHDSIADLGGDVSTLARSDAGHFAGDTMAFRDWDGEGEVPFACAKCHSATGLPEFVKNGGTVVLTTAGSTTTTGLGNQPASNGFTCYTCHDEANWPALYAFAQVAFPNGKTLSFAQDADGKNIEDPANLCLACHQGRESSVTVRKYLGSKEADTVDAKISFKNVHYFAAGATLFGSEAQGIFQYEGKEYVGRFMHTDGFQTCTSCHDAHALEPKLEACAGCHQTDDPAAIRMTSTADYDGDGDVAEGLEGELKGLQDKLYAEIQKYADTKAGVAIVYDTNAYPYWYADANKDGVGDKDDKGAGVRYATWTPRLLKAAYNLQYSLKDSGAAIHNFKYVAEALYDSIEDLGGDVTGLTRP
jgi:hypothetical protein